MDNPAYPPKNRASETLDVLLIKIDDGSGNVYTTCPNGAVGCAIWGLTGEKPEFNGRGLLPGSVLFNPLELVPKPGVKSVISGRDAVTYRSDDIVIDMTPAELLRFLCRDLHAGEYFRVREHTGMFYEIHEDFYDDRTGESWQPVRLNEEEVRPEKGPGFRP